MKKITILLMLSLIGLSGFSQVNLDSGLVAKYYFNGNADDESGNGNNGTVNGATLSTDRFGNINSTYSFDGIDDYIVVPHSSSLDLTTAITRCAWIRPTAFYQGECQGNNIISKGQLSEYWGLYYGENDGSCGYASNTNRYFGGFFHVNHGTPWNLYNVPNPISDNNTVQQNQ
ncbi:MAG: hypothetical protein HY738_10945 [Bacteroidia bacterium]|nr:hypothetical protein [Bacteroidia bacterium]